jgi:hypothetical protein
MLVERKLPRAFSLRRLCFSHSLKQLLWEITMKTRIALFALALAALPFAAQPASAQGYYDRLDRDEARIARDNHRIWHERADIARDWRALARERGERNYAAFREREALWRGNYGAARYFNWRRRHEQAEIAAERGDIARDRQHLADERFQRDIDVAHRNYDEGWRR